MLPDRATNGDVDSNDLALFGLRGQLDKPLADTPRRLRQQVGVLHAAHRHDASLTRVGGHSRTLAQASVLRLGFGFALPGDPGCRVVQGATSFDDDVDCVVLGPHPDHVGIRVDDGTGRCRRRGEHGDAGG
jgi:hypothetical protein